MTPTPEAVVGNVARSLSDRLLEAATGAVSGSTDREREAAISAKLGRSSYRIGPRHVRHVTVDLLDGAVTALTLEIAGPHLLGNLAPEYHIPSPADVEAAVEAASPDLQATTRAVGDDILEEVHLVIHERDPQQVHRAVSAFCRCVETRL